VIDSHSCDQWPENLKSLRECCNVPHHANSILLNHCFVTCKSNETDDDQQSDCAAHCYANMTLLMSENGKINKNVVKRIYGNNAFYEQKWSKLIGESADDCEFDESENLSKSLAKYFDCINKNLEENCVSFVNNFECDKVQEHFEACKNVKPDCKNWPSNLFAPEICCQTPQLFNEQEKLTCDKKCSKIQLFTQFKLKCVDKCLFDETGVRNDDEFDFTVIKKLLNENTRNEEWKNVIEKAAEKCETKLKEFQGSNTNEKMQNSYLLTCLHDQMSENCVEFRDDSNCNKVRRYMKHCPDAKPNRDRLFQVTYKG
jgi:hypothetical protein